MDILQPMVQYGFLGFAAVLLAIIVWLIQKLLSVLEQTNRVIAANTEAINKLAATTAELVDRQNVLHEKIITRPCVAMREAS